MSEKSKCYGCGSASLQLIHTFSDFSSCGVFVEDGNSAPRSDINIYICRTCSLTQSHIGLSVEELYGDQYGYRSSLNKSMVAHLSQKASELSSRYDFDTVLDVGSNDGTFLGEFDVKTKIGVDPSISCGEHCPEAHYIKGLFPNSETNSLENKSVDLITANSVFYDLPDVELFLNEVSRLLADDGVLHIELSYLKMMLEQNSIDTICHEHLEYYSVKSLNHLLGQSGFTITRLGFNEINGGSIWIDAQKSGRLLDEVVDLIALEDSIGLNDGSALTKFFERCDIQRMQLRALLQHLVDNGNKINGLGASTKGNMLLQYAGIDRSLVQCIEEINPTKFGKKTPGSNIPIVEQSLNGADYYLVLPWHFRSFFLEQQAFRKKRLIFPMPNLSITYT